MDEALSRKRRNGFRCFECDQPAHHAHHVVPLSLGGTRTLPLCHSCHHLIHHRSGLTTQSQLTRAGIKQASVVRNSPRRSWNHRDLPIAIIQALHASGESNVAIAKLFGVHESSIRRRLKPK